MARRKLTTWESALKEAARELALPKDDFRVEKLATLTLLLKVQRAQWANGKLTNSGDMIEVMNAIEALRSTAGGPREILVNVVKAVSGIFTCARCGHENRLAEGAYTTPPESRTTGHAKPAEAPSTDGPDETLSARNESLPRDALPASAPAPAPSPPRRNGSVSAFHNQPGVPLKRLQPSPYAIRKISPMGG
jgi:hypothetical protein